MSRKRQLDELAREHYDRLFRAALFMCNDPEVAADLVQETFLAAVNALPAFEGRSSHYTWLYGILLNKFRGWLRQKNEPLSLQERAEESDAADAAEMLADAAPGVEATVERRETDELVREVLDSLPAHHRGVLVLRYLEDMSYEDVAKALDCSLGTVKSRIHYALRKVGEKLKQRQELLP